MEMHHGTTLTSILMILRLEQQGGSTVSSCVSPRKSSKMEMMCRHSIFLKEVNYGVRILFRFVFTPNAHSEISLIKRDATAECNFAWHWIPSICVEQES